MLSNKEKFSKNYINARGWRTKTKLLLIESDDWGTIRMPSIQVRGDLSTKGIDLEKLSFDSQDSLESKEDLEKLFEVLCSVNDCLGNPAVLTAYHVLANPNFEAIESNGRKSYVYETFLDTYNRNPHTQGTFEWVKKGISKGIYIPQFHGREHIHVKRWMEAINSSSIKEQMAFQNQAIIWTGLPQDPHPYKNDYFKGFDYDSELEIIDLLAIHKDGLRLFKEIFGMDSITFTAQGSVWGNQILPMLKDEGVKLIGGHQLLPKGRQKYKIVNRYWGSKNHLGQIYWRRNVLFEPGRDQSFDWVSRCMAEIEIAYRWGKPAVISSHRENFIGSIFKENRTQSLHKLQLLLRKVTQKWPDVQFISSAQLAEIMLQSKN